MAHVIAQTIGVIVSALCLISPQMKKRWQMLCFTILANALSAAHFLLLGEPSAVGVCAVAMVQASIGVVYSRLFQRPHLYLTVPLFSVGYVAAGLLPYLTEGTLETFTWIDALPIVGALLLMCSVIMKYEQQMRLFSLANILVFITYDILVASTQIFAQIIGLVSVLVALWRYRKKKQPATEAQSTDNDPQKNETEGQL